MKIAEKIADPLISCKSFLHSRTALTIMALLLLALTLSLVQPPAQQAQTLPTLDAEEQAFLTLINDYRRQNGLGTLQVSIALTNAADWLSADMGSKNYFSHTDSLGRSVYQRLTAFGYNYNTWWGENIAAGNSGALATFNQWKNSSSHNSNMLNPNYKVIGIGRVYTATSTYKYYWTTDFGGYIDQVLPVSSPTPSPTTSPTPAATPTPTPTAIPTPVATPTPTPTPTPTATPTPTPAATPTPTPSTDGSILNPSFESGSVNWTPTGSISFVTGTGVTSGTYAARLSAKGSSSVASLFQWVKLTPGATYEVTADVYSDGRALTILGVKWGNYSDGPALLYTGTTKMTLRFTVPTGSATVGLYISARGSGSRTVWATSDNFRLVRIN